MTEQPTTTVVDPPAPDVPLLRIPRSAVPVPTEPRLQSRRVPVWAYVLVVLAVVGGMVVAARSLGWFVTSGRGTVLAGSGPAAGRAPAASAVPGASVAPGTSPAPTAHPTPNPTGTGPGAGSGTEEKVAPTAGSDPADVKGWMTVQQVLDAFPVTKAALYSRFAIPADTPTETTLSGLKEVEGVTDFDVPGLRTWLGEQSG